MIEHKPFRQVCCDLGHVFLLEVERADDLTVSDVENLDQTPYVLFRQRTLVQCPMCTSLVHFTGIRGEMEVNFTPSGGAN